LASAAAPFIPQVLVEPFHGASDLTPRERDIAADVMGLRQKQWPGWTPARYVALDHYVMVGNGPKVLLRSFAVSRPEPALVNTGFGTEWVACPREGWSGSVSVEMENSDLLANLINGDADWQPVPMRVVVGGVTVFDAPTYIDLYSIIDDHVELDISQAGPGRAPDIEMPWPGVWVDKRRLEPYLVPLTTRRQT
jgi:hypothetical protein